MNVTGPIYVTQVVIGRTGLTLMARAMGNNATPITRASLTSGTWKVVDRQTGQVLGSGTLTISSVVFDTIQFTGQWTVDAIGYNVLFVIPAAALSGPNPSRCQAELKFIPVTGEQIIIPFKFTLDPTFS